MKWNYNVLTALCLVASVPFAWLFLHRRSGTPALPVVRCAVFDVGSAGGGAAVAWAADGSDTDGRVVAEIVQRTEPDVLLLAGFGGGEAAAAVFADRYLGTGQGGRRALHLDFHLAGPDWALFSAHPILGERVRTFARLPWAKVPGAARPADLADAAAWATTPLSAGGLCDVPIGVGPVADARVLHVLCAVAARPGARADERATCRNRDELRFWADYLTPGADAWIADDAGRTGGLPADAPFVLLGALGVDPADGPGAHDALAALLARPRLVDAEPKGPGGAEAAQRQFGANAGQRGDPLLDTADLPDAEGGPGNLRTEYVLVDRSLGAFARGVFWPPGFESTTKLADALPHKLVFVDVGAK